MTKEISNIKEENVKNNQLSVSHKSSQFSPEYSDSEVWEAFCSDSMMAFKSIYIKHSDLLYNYGKKIVVNEEVVKDSLQDFFIDLWNRRNKLGRVDNIRAYLFVGFRRKLVEKKRKLQRFQAIDEIENFEIVFSLAQIEFDLTEEKKKTLLVALNDLPERQKEAVFLRFYNKLSCHEIGDVMDINSQSVYNLIHRSLKVLRRVLVAISFLLIGLSPL